MEIKPCTLCGTEQHHNNGQLCVYCAEDKHEAFELRLIDDSQPSWMTLAARAVWGEQEQPERRWWVE